MFGRIFKKTPASTPAQSQKPYDYKLNATKKDATHLDKELYCMWIEGARQAMALVPLELPKLGSTIYFHRPKLVKSEIYGNSFGTGRFTESIGSESYPIDVSTQYHITAFKAGYCSIIQSQDKNIQKMIIAAV